MKVWRDHSLTIVLFVIGSAFMGYAVTIDSGRWFDFIISMGVGVWTVCLFYVLAGPLRERNRPEA